LPPATHPHFIGCQFHPELQSRPLRPHPLFAAFVAAADRRRRGSADVESAAPALAHVNQ
jgi:CTP synthase